MPEADGVRWTFAAVADAPLGARRIVTEWLGNAHAALPTAHLLVSEVVTNVVRHTGQPGELRLRSSGNGLRVEVEDRSRRPPRIRSDSSPDGGFGLRLVDALSSRWGSEWTPEGKTVWFELDAGDADLASGRAGHSADRATG